MLKLLVFDLDGTLADTREDLAASVNHALAALGLPTLPLPAVMEKVGNGARVLIQSSLEDARSRAGASLPAPEAGETERALSEFLAHYGAHCLVETRAYPGAAEALGKLAGYRKAVLTNKPEAPARRILEGLGLAPHFDFILGGDNPHGKKPDPAALEWLMASARAEPRATAMIGDGVQDARAARRAGAFLIGYLGGIGPRADLLAEGPDAAVEAFGELPGAVTALEARLAASVEGKPA